MRSVQTLHDQIECDHGGAVHARLEHVQPHDVVLTRIVVAQPEREGAQYLEVVVEPCKGEVVVLYRERPEWVGAKGADVLDEREREMEVRVGRVFGVVEVMDSIVFADVCQYLRVFVPRSFPDRGSPSFVLDLRMMGVDDSEFVSGFEVVGTSVNKGDGHREWKRPENGSAKIWHEQLMKDFNRRMWHRLVRTGKKRRLSARIIGRNGETNGLKHGHGGLELKEA